jgi:hypothetical protein
MGAYIIVFFIIFSVNSRNLWLSFGYSLDIENSKYFFNCVAFLISLFILSEIYKIELFSKSMQLNF